MNHVIRIDPNKPGPVIVLHYALPAPAGPKAQSEILDPETIGCLRIPEIRIELGVRRKRGRPKTTHPDRVLHDLRGGGGLRFSQWREAAMKRGISRSDFQRSLKALTLAGRVVNVDGEYRLVECMGSDGPKPL